MDDLPSFDPGKPVPERPRFKARHKFDVIGWWKYLNTYYPQRDRRFSLCFLATGLSTFLALYDVTILATLTEEISQNLDAVKLVPLITSAYTIVQTAVSPVISSLTAYYGRKNGLLACNAIFAFGTLLCGIAGLVSQKGVGIGLLLAGRAIAGCGGGGMFIIPYGRSVLHPSNSFC